MIKKEKEEAVEEKEEANEAPAIAKPERKWELDSKLNTLLEAVEIMNDEKLMKEVRAHAEGKKKKIESLADLRTEALKVPSGEDKIV